MSLEPIADLRAFLSGRWEIARRIRDRRGGVEGAFLGEAGFSPRGEGLDYLEEGEMKLGQSEGRAFRRYRYDFPERGRAEVFFEDGRFFHDLRFGHEPWRVRHDCPPDLYAGRFRLSGLEEWQAIWLVRGPRKLHLLESRYRRHNT